jgi:hypothetical protein
LASLQIIGGQSRQQFGPDVVLLECRRVLSEPQRPQPLGDILGPEDVDLRDVREIEELLADVVHVVPQLPVREAVGREAEGA